MQEERIVDFLKKKGISPEVIIDICRDSILELDIVAVEEALDKYEELELNPEGDAYMSKWVRYEDRIRRDIPELLYKELEEHQ